VRIGEVKHILGSDKAIADACGVSRQAVNNWLVIPYKYRERVLEAIEKKKKIIDRAIKVIDQQIEELENENNKHTR